MGDGYSGLAGLLARSVDWCRRHFPFAEQVYQQTKGMRALRREADFTAQRYEALTAGHEATQRARYELVDIQKWRRERKRTADASLGRAMRERLDRSERVQVAKVSGATKVVLHPDADSYHELGIVNPFVAYFIDEAHKAWYVQVNNTVRQLRNPVTGLRRRVFHLEDWVPTYLLAEYAEGTSDELLVQQADKFKMWSLEHRLALSTALTQALPKASLLPYALGEKLSACAADSPEPLTASRGLRVLTEYVPASSYPAAEQFRMPIPDRWEGNLHHDTVFRDFSAIEQLLGRPDVRKKLVVAARKKDFEWLDHLTQFSSHDEYLQSICAQEAYEARTIDHDWETTIQYDHPDHELGNYLLRTATPLDSAAFAHWERAWYAGHGMESVLARGGPRLPLWGRAVRLAHRFREQCPGLEPWLVSYTEELTGVLVDSADLRSYGGYRAVLAHTERHAHLFKMHADE